MGGCASKKKGGKEEAYKPADAPVEEPIVAANKSAVSSQPAKQNGDASGPDAATKNQFRNSLTGPMNVIMPPSQPETRTESYPSLRFIDDESGDEVEDAPTPAVSTDTPRPTPSAPEPETPAVAVPEVTSEEVQPTEVVRVEINGASNDMQGGVTVHQPMEETEAPGQETSYPGPPIDSRESTDLGAEIAAALSEETSAVVGEVTQNGLAAANEAATNTEEVAESVEDAKKNVSLEAASGGAIQFGDKSTVEFREGFEFKNGELPETESKETPSGMTVKARGAGGPGIVQIGTGNKIIYGAKHPDSKPPEEFNGFIPAEVADDLLRKSHDNTEAMATLEQIVQAAKSVGYIYSEYGYVTGTGFRVGDKFMMTAYHLIREILEQIPALGTAAGEEELLMKNQIWIQFSFKFGQQELDDHETRFRFASIPYANIDLDIAIIELETPQGKQLPDPFVNFCNVAEQRKLEFIGHDAGRDKRRDPDCSVYKPTLDDISKASQWCVEKGLPEDGYEGLKLPNKIRFHCMFKHGASGSPGVVVIGSQVFVVVVLTKGYPSFYWNLAYSEKDKIPNSFLLEEGTSITSVYEDMKQQQLEELCNNIFGFSFTQAHS